MINSTIRKLYSLHCFVNTGRHEGSLYTATSSGSDGDGSCPSSGYNHYTRDPRTTRPPQQHQQTDPQTGGRQEEKAAAGLDGAYIRLHLGSVLVKALAEISSLRPQDPVQYLAEYLYRVDEMRRYEEEVRLKEI